MIRLLILYFFIVFLWFFLSFSYFLALYGFANFFFSFFLHRFFSTPSLLVSKFYELPISFILSFPHISYFFYTFLFHVLFAFLKFFVSIMLGFEFLNFFQLLVKVLSLIYQYLVSFSLSFFLSLVCYFCFHCSFSYILAIIFLLLLFFLLSSFQFVVVSFSLPSFPVSVFYQLPFPPLSCLSSLVLFFFLLFLPTLLPSHTTNSFLLSWRC